MATEHRISTGPLGGPAVRGRSLGPAVVFVAGAALSLLGVALLLDLTSLRAWTLRLPWPALARAAYQLHAALDHPGAQLFEALLAALGVCLLVLGPLLATRHRAAQRAVAALAALLLLGCAGALVAIARSDDYGGEIAFRGLSRRHQAGPIVSPRLPPPGGPHSPTWQNCGVYDRPIPNEYAVHSLEHGAVWIAYRPDLPASEVGLLRALVAADPYRLLSPYPDLLSPIVASAWGRQLLLDRADDPRLAAFIARYAGAPTAPEPRGPCTGGNGQPLR